MKTVNYWALITVEWVFESEVSDVIDRIVKIDDKGNILKSNIISRFFVRMLHQWDYVYDYGFGNDVLGLFVSDIKIGKLNKKYKL